MLKWEKTTKKDIEIAGKIVDRALKELQSLAQCPKVEDLIALMQMDLVMDILAAHEEVGLDLKGLLEADPLTFCHDVYGIYRHMDRATGILTDYFLPRCHKPHPRKEEVII